jgi:glutamate racemase
MLVVACNSIEVAAIADVADAHGVPVVGVIDPGVRAAVHATRNHRIGLIGTEATVASGAYERAIARTGADVRLFSAACPVFVEHVEAGDTSSDELLGAARGYLVPLDEEGIDTLILGCTHYPMLSGLIRMVMGEDVLLVSSAEETAKDVYARSARPPCCGRPRTGKATRLGTSSSPTGDPAQFRRVAHHFLGPVVGGVAPVDVRVVEGVSWS